jgi:hypothetical protein
VKFLQKGVGGKGARKNKNLHVAIGAEGYPDKR